MNYIERDVYVLENRIKEKIDYVRGTNALPIYFHFRDYEIPEGVERQELTKKREQRIRLVGLFNWFRFLM